jgi:hypothetical protein
VAIGAEHAQVLKAVVVADAVDVVYLHGQWLAEPLAKPALLTTIL